MEHIEDVQASRIEESDPVSISAEDHDWESQVLGSWVAEMGCH